MNFILCKGKTVQYLARYFHATCFSPTSKTLINVIKINHFVSWPGLTSDPFVKHLPLIIPTAKGHLNIEIQILQSTKSSRDPQNDGTSDKLYPLVRTRNDRTYDVVVYIIISFNYKAYMDIIRRFPYFQIR